MAFLSCNTDTKILCENHVKIFVTTATQVEAIILKMWFASSVSSFCTLMPTQTNDASFSSEFMQYLYHRPNNRDAARRLLIGRQWRPIYMRINIT